VLVIRVLLILMLAMAMPAPSQADQWSLFSEPVAESDTELFGEREMPSVLSTSYQETVPAAAAGTSRMAMATQLPPPAEEMPVPPGQPPPSTRANFNEIPADNIDNRDQPLTLSDVLESVLRHYPLLLATEQERGVASGGLTSAMGAFDTRLTGMGSSLAPSTYENYISDFGMEQLLTQRGISVFGGYRTGYGTFPTYKLHNKTAAGGEFRGGVSVPLARNRDIDTARAGRAQAQLNVALAEPAIARSRLDYMRAAAHAYWMWAGSGEQRIATESLVKLATDRDQFLAARVERGATANIERIDNQKNIAIREGMAVKADRAVQQAAIDLSLYYRDETGRPLLVGPRRFRRLPEPIEPSPSLYYESLSRALDRRPEFRKLSLEREKLLVERRLAANETLPGLDAEVAANQDLGFGKSPLSGPEGLNRQVLSATLIFQVPAQRRGARGRLQALASKITQIDEQLRYLEDHVKAEVQDAYSKLERAYAFHEKTLEMVVLSDTVAKAEREQFRLGRSDILRIALREQAKFDADLFEIVARQQFWTAESDLRAADTSLGPGATGEEDAPEEVPLPPAARTDAAAIPPSPAEPSPQPRMLR
jgi:outer membrane protein TolC